ncbi:DUF4424 domain-containing protein [Massilia sp. CCM 8734]|nr:DUF4424 domain-containing protein [Massilia sp. CCM 8734]
MPSKSDLVRTLGHARSRWRAAGVTLRPALPRRGKIRARRTPPPPPSVSDIVSISSILRRRPSPSKKHTAMTRLTTPRTAALAALFLPVLALANDGIAGVSAGGIVFRKTDAIAMKKEVLNVSRSLISVDYEFVNESSSDLEETIVFPLPAYQAMKQDSDTYYGQPAEFSIKVDGKAVGFSTRVIALHAKEDITAQLKKLGLSDAQIAFNSSFASKTKVAPLTAKQRQQLSSLNLLEQGADGDTGPVWEVQVNYIWKQVFPAGKVVRVHHAYRPFVSGGPGEWGMNAEVAKTYCADKEFLSTWKKLAARTPDRLVPAEHVSYILKTGNTWKRGIDDFTLNVIKRHPAEIVSLCFPGTFRKIDANTFQVRLSNFQPADDLQVYFGNIDAASESSGVMPVLAK